MDSMLEKSRLIMEHEQQFADVLAGKVLDKPQPNIWMILLPILFVFYMNDYKKFKDGKKLFAAHYLVTKQRALAEALAVVQSGKAADPLGLADQSELAPEAQGKLVELFAVLIGHYEVLLQAAGDNLPALVRAAYRNRTNYLLFINQLNQAEKNLSLALKPPLDTTADGVNDILSAIASHTEQIRRGQAQIIFG